jgi:protein subunit release factor A
VPLDEEDRCNDIVLEVSAGVGGQEAMLFARELFDMYCSYITYKDWVMETADLELSELGLLHLKQYTSKCLVFWDITCCGALKVNDVLKEHVISIFRVK